MQGKKPTIVAVSVLFIVMFLVMDLYTIQIWSDAVNPAPETLTEIDESIIADNPPPRAAFSLSDLVTKLLEVTPTDAEDSDMDGLPNSVEAVLGTDPYYNDTDMDSLTDDFEVWNGFDPLEPDTNFDGLPDYFEAMDSRSIALGLDLDGDGVPNAWDFDNDDDMVGDAADISPFSKSVMSDKMYFDISTNGNPLFVSFQLIPENPDHLSMINQYWDWPYDDLGEMRDLHTTPGKDVSAQPLLKLSLSDSPLQEDVAKYSISVTPDATYIPLYPVLDSGDIVAFTGRLVYPDSVPSLLSIEVELIWNILGRSDERVYSLAGSNGYHVSIGMDGIARANSSSTSIMETFQWIELDESTVALKLYDGPYLSVAADGSLRADGLDIGVNETFEVIFEDGSFGLKSLTNDMYVTIDSNDMLVALASEFQTLETFQRTELEPQTETKLLVTYNEDFMLTGFTIEESYGSDVGITFSSTPDETLLAQLPLSVEFARRTDTHISDLASILATYNLAVDTLTGFYPNTDDAFTAMNNDLIPTALEIASTDDAIPVIVAIEDQALTIEMSEIDSISYEMSNQFDVDLEISDITTTKSLKTVWYSDAKVLTLEEIAIEIDELGLEESLSFDLLGLSIVWSVGEQIIPVERDELHVLGIIDDIQDLYEDPKLEIYGFMTSILDPVKEIYKTWNTYKSSVAELAGVCGKGQFSKWSILKDMATETDDSLANVFKYRKIQQGNSAKALARNANRFRRNIGQGIDVALLLLEIGLAMYNVINIATSGMGAMELNEALLMAVMQYALMLAMTALATTGVGAILSALFGLFDLIFGWSDKLFGKIIDAMSDVDSISEPVVDVIGDPSIDVIDYDQNGIEVGDRITYEGLLQGLAYGSNEDNADQSMVYPYYLITAPFGSSSSTGTLYPYRDVYVRSTGEYWSLPIPSGSWTSVDFVDGSDYYFGQIYNSGAWIEPGIPMINFPVNVEIKAFTHLWYHWSHFVFLGFYAFWCHHDSHQEQYVNAGRFTINFDILPGSFDDFADWRSIAPLDFDGDGLSNIEEPGPERYKYDNDGDALNDMYELEVGTNPNEPDSDFDGLNDKYEIMYGTNATNPDSDSDGVRDYLEISGYTIQFNYLDESSLPFTMIVHSNPRSNDTDLDGISDFDERRDGLNPSSGDTNGDGVADEVGPASITEFEQVWSNVPKLLSSPNDLALDESGAVYVSNPGGIQKYDSNGHRINYNDYSWESPTGIAVLPDGNLTGIDIRDPVSTPSLPYGASHYFEPWGDLVDHRLAFLQKQAPPMDYDYFGRTVVIGDPGRNMAYIYYNSDQGWIRTNTLYDPDVETFPNGGAFHTFFGASVAMDDYGDNVVVGAPGLITPDGYDREIYGSKYYPSWWMSQFPARTYRNAGGVYVYAGRGAYETKQWFLHERILGPYGDAWLGATVEIDPEGRRVFASVNNPTDGSGSVMVWHCIRPGDLDDEWWPAAWIGCPNPSSYGAYVVPSLLGRRIYSLSVVKNGSMIEPYYSYQAYYEGCSLIIGAYNAKDTSVGTTPAHSGIAVVIDLKYTWTQMSSWTWGTSNWPYHWEAWSLRPAIEAPDNSVYDQFGFSVSGDDGAKRVVVGAPHHEHGELWVGNEWTQGTGAAYVYEFSNNAWSLATSLEVPDLALESEFGYSVASSQNLDVIVVGAPGSDHHNGSAYVFRKFGGKWSPIEKLTNYYDPIIGNYDGLGNRFGHQVSINSRGSQIRVNTRSWFSGFTAEVICEFNSDNSRQYIRVTDPAGLFFGSSYNTIQHSGWGPPDPTYGTRFWGLTSDDQGYLFGSFYDEGISGIRKFSPWDFQPYMPIPEPLANIGWDKLEWPKGLDIDSNGLIYVADYGADRVWIFDSNGDIPDGTPPILGTSDLNLNSPSDVAVDENGCIYVADTGNDRIVKFDSELMWEGTLNVAAPLHIEVDDDGFIYVANATHLMKYSQTVVVLRPDVEDPVLDWDSDDLDDVFEETGWTISFTDANGVWSKHVNSSMYLKDTDLDTIPDYQEWVLGSNPQSIDTDRDAMPDAEELKWGTNLTCWDTDGDLLDDSIELNIGTNPFVQDSDGDGTSDYFEHLWGTDPLQIDTDRDGANDTAEFDAGTDPLSPDSDGDFVFDGAEFDAGTDPLNSDSDGDMIIDGGEWLLGTDPLSNDTDGDNVTDMLELMLAMNPLSNDTDGDGALDSFEILMGTSPISNQSTPPELAEIQSAADIILAYDADSGAEEFAEALAQVANITVVSLEDLMANYTDAQRIILVGQPNLELGTVGGLISSLLWDYGDALTRLNESIDCDYLTRYGVWNNTQLVLMFSEASPTDVTSVLEVMKFKNVTILPDSYFVEYQKLVGLEIQSEVSNPYFLLDEMDMIKQTDSTLLVVLGASGTPNVVVNLYNETTTPYVLSPDTGLQGYEEALGKYLKATVTFEDAPDDIVSMVMIKMYYRLVDLDATGDGDADDIDDFNETTLYLYLYAESIGEWIRLSEGLDWVLEVGVNTTDIVLFGEYYAGYVWAYVTHLSMYSIGGQLNNRPPDVSNAFPSIEFLWPPNGKFVEVSIEGVTDPDGDDVTITILNITSDEFVGWCPDAYGVGSDTAWLRAERSGCGNGRVYEITFLASDGRGGETIGSVFVYVPHNRKKCAYVIPINDGHIYDATEGWRPHWWHRKWWGHWHGSHCKQKCH